MAAGCGLYPPTIATVIPTQATLIYSTNSKKTTPTAEMRAYFIPVGDILTVLYPKS